ADADGIAAGADVFVSRSISAAPVATLSPTLIFKARTTPAFGAGTSIEALSDSSTAMVSPSAMVSPTLTLTSITSTASLVPISGIWMASIAETGTADAAVVCATGATTAAAGAAGATAGAGAGATAGCTAVADGGSAAVSVSSTSSGLPCETLSPTFNNSDFTVPVIGAGISIEALSDSSTISESSLLTVSPGFTQISITSTFSAPPISGTVRFCVATNSFPQPVIFIRAALQPARAEKISPQYQPDTLWCRVDTKRRTRFMRR